MALIKYVEFGGTDPNTGEKRVQLIDNDLIKTASNEIQDYWRELVRKPECFYLHVIAMSAGEYWGPNKRSDWYGEENLKKYHHQFVTQAKVYKHHINKPDSPSYGRVLYSFYNDNMHRVELILEVDKENAQEYVDKINNGEDIFVSMGMRVPKDECSVCGNIATKLSEYCVHGKNMRNQILANNELVYRINHAPYNLFDISLVTRPADPVAWAMEKAASDGTQVDYSDTVRVLDEDVYNAELLLKEAVDKVADLIKKVDAPVLDSKTPLDNNINKLKSMHTPIKFPSMSYDELEDLHLHPGVALLSAFMGKVHLSIDELAYYIGMLTLGKMFNKYKHQFLCDNVSAALSISKREPLDSLRFIKHIGESLTSPDIDIDEEIQRLTPHISNTEDSILIIKEGGLIDHPNFRKHPEDYTTDVSYKELMAMPNMAMIEVFNKKDPSDKILTSVRDIKDNLILSKPLYDYSLQPISKTIGLMSMFGGALSLLGGDTKAQVLSVPTMIIGALLMRKSTPSDDPVELSRHAYIEKSASDGGVVNKISKLPTVPLLGMGIPTLLAGDYIYNKFRAQRDPNVINNMSNLSYNLYRAGEQVTNNPLLSIGTGIGVAAFGKGVGTELLKKIRRGG